MTAEEWKSKYQDKWTLRQMGYDSCLHPFFVDAPRGYGPQIIRHCAFCNAELVRGEWVNGCIDTCVNYRYIPK
jgi:hypothetical protein